LRISPRHGGNLVLRRVIFRNSIGRKMRRSSIFYPRFVRVLSRTIIRNGSWRVARIFPRSPKALQNYFRITPTLIG
jgi:hypothetical protein